MSILSLMAKAVNKQVFPKTPLSSTVRTREGEETSQQVVRLERKNQCCTHDRADGRGWTTERLQGEHKEHKRPRQMAQTITLLHRGWRAEFEPQHL